MGDVAILHVDSTFTPMEYITFARSFPICLNAGATNISKRYISGAVLRNGEHWKGPVIVKSNLNCSGVPELRLIKRARSGGKRPPYPVEPIVASYTIYQSVNEVPPDAFGDQNLVVEKFLPEIDRDGYATRFWVFCGDGERCTRYVSTDQLVKGANVVRRESISVPEELRLRRIELGFDFGKFDFVMYEGKAVLLDANKTPFRPPNLSQLSERQISDMANGFEKLVSARHRKLDKIFGPARAIARLPNQYWASFRTWVSARGRS
jgi:hypothetical protein